MSADWPFIVPKLTDAQAITAGYLVYRASTEGTWGTIERMIRAGGPRAL